MFVRRTLGCACDGMLDPRGAARPSTESPGGCYVTARHDVATVGESLTGLSERSARHVLVGRGIVKSLKRSGCAAVSRTHKTKSLCDRSGLQTALLVTLTALGVTLTVPSLAQAEQGKCQNEALREARSASLPDCRAYELVTPENLGRTQDMTFTKDDDHAIPSGDGEHVALEAGLSPLEPNPQTSADAIGTYAVFSRTPEGWVMKSAVARASAAERPFMRLLSPDLSQVALVSYTALNLGEANNPPAALEVGPVGGPYAVVANLPERAGTNFLGANAGTPGVPAFSNVVFSSVDHNLLPPGPELALAEETSVGAPDLYEWTDGVLRLVNVEGEGAHLKLVNNNRCGATLGAGFASVGAGTVGAVSADGSNVFFTTEPCEGEPRSVYMRVDGRETIAIPPLASVDAPERRPVLYNGATADGSEVFFNTGTPLSAAGASSGNLYMYDTMTGVLKRIGNVREVPGTGGGEVLLSEDGATAYYTASGLISRYDTRTGESMLVATAKPSKLVGEPSYTTPNGEFLVFVAGGIEVDGKREVRGWGHNELYRYDAIDGSVMCVSCGYGVAPEGGEMLEPTSVVYGTLETEDETPPFVQMSEDGREVFFETTARLLPQDTNSTVTEISSPRGTPGMDVYEWEADGAGGCVLSQGCTYLLSSGENVGPAIFLGASRNGSNVFFSSASQLVPQATPEFTNIYDAREDGGFPPRAVAGECLSCQGVGSPPPLFSVPSSGSFVGAGNPVMVGHPAGPPKCKRRSRHRKHGRCLPARSRKGGRR